MQGYSKEHALVIFAMKNSVLVFKSDGNEGKTGPEPVPDVNIGRISNKSAGPEQASGRP